MIFQDFFQDAMKRSLPDLLDPPPGIAFDLGASGYYTMKGALALGLPIWSFPRDAIPAKDDSVAIIHAYHFMEHLSGDDAIKFLREAERVLIEGGILNYCVPYHKTGLQAQDLTHKSVWNEDVFENLFNNTHYDPAGDPREWLLKVHFQIIAGVVERNLALIGQLVKTATR
jgi:SAM-dependent methyltransferase